MNLFGVGPGEAFLVIVIALLVVGPDRFPEVARQAARYYKLARRYTDEVMKDVRAAVDELESEVGGPGEDLRSIREIGSGLVKDLSAMGDDTKATLEATSAEAAAAMPTADDTSVAAPVATETAEADTAETTEATPAEPAAEAASATDETPAPAAHEPLSLRPSKRAAAKAPSDPFAALEAKRARDRERSASEPPSGNGHQ